MKQDNIPNLNIVQTYDKFYKNSYIHYESLGNLASFFGRAMHLHRHDRYYQLHFIHQGKVHLNLGDKEYIEQAPLLFFTPPPIPHGFVTDTTASGHVLTVHHSLVEQLLQTLNHNDLHLSTMPACITLKDLPEEMEISLTMLEYAFKGLHQEIKESEKIGQSTAQLNWAQLILINLFRLIASTNHVVPSEHSHSNTFRKFLSLIEEYYNQHLPITDYAKLLNITEGQLNKVCRAITDTSSKQLIYERQILEAKYLLTYTSLSIKQVAFELGFQDPAYFTRFFIKHTNSTPKNYRQTQSKSIS